MSVHKAHVYSIKCLKNDEIYIGCSLQVSSRWGLHRWELEHGVHSNKRLQEDWTRFGQAFFAFTVIETIENPDRQLRSRQWKNLRDRAELYWIEKIGTYNEHVAKKNTDATKFTQIPELRAKMDAGLKTRQKNGYGQNAKKLKELWQDPDYVAAQKERGKSAENVEILRAAAQKRWSQPQAAEKHSAAIINTWEERIKTKKSGLPRGVSTIKNSSKFRATLWKNGKSHHLGVFDTVEQASAAVEAAA